MTNLGTRKETFENKQRFMMEEPEADPVVALFRVMGTYYPYPA